MLTVTKQQKKRLSGKPNLGSWPDSLNVRREVLMQQEKINVVNNKTTVTVPTNKTCAPGGNRQILVWYWA